MRQVGPSQARFGRDRVGELFEVDDRARMRSIHRDDRHSKAAHLVADRGVHAEQGEVVTGGERVSELFRERRGVDERGREGLGEGQAHES